MNFGKIKNDDVLNEKIQSELSETNKRNKREIEFLVENDHSQGMGMYPPFTVSFQFEAKDLRKDFFEAFKQLSEYHNTTTYLSSLTEHNDYKFIMRDNNVTVLSLKCSKLENDGCNFNQLVQEFEYIAKAHNCTFVIKDEKELGYK